MHNARFGKLLRGCPGVCLLAGFVSSMAQAASLPLAEAIRQALSQNPDVRVQDVQIDAARAQQQQAAGQFDWTLSSGLDYARTVTPLPPSSAAAQTRAYSSGYRLGVSKQLRNGVQFSGDMNASTASDDTPLAQQNLLKLNVTLTVPLLKGRGAQAAAAAEDAAKINVLRSRYDLRDRAAQTLYNTMLAYWDYRTRVALYNVALDSEARSKGLLESTQKLIDASEKPRADLVLLKADWGDKVASTQAAALALSESRKTLGRLLGMNMAAINQLPEPADDFPAVSNLTAAMPAKLPLMNQMALAQRADLKSLALQIEALQRQFQAAQNRQKPQLDLNVGIGYGRASEGGARLGLANEPGRTPSEPSVFAHLNYQFPLENNLAVGVSRDYAAQLAQLAIRQRDLADTISSGVDSAVQALIRNAAQLQVAQDGLALYEQAVKQEIIKQKNGIATLIDVINVEARFVNARVNYLQSQLAYANALARLRYETASFFPPYLISDSTSDNFSLDMHDLAGLGPLAGLLQQDIR